MWKISIILKNKYLVRRTEIGVQYGVEMLCESQQFNKSRFLGALVSTPGLGQHRRLQPTNQPNQVTHVTNQPTNHVGHISVMQEQKRQATMQRRNIYVGKYILYKRVGVGLDL